MGVLRRCKGNHHFGFSKRKTDGNVKFWSYLRNPLFENNQHYVK